MQISIKIILSFFFIILQKPNIICCYFSLFQNLSFQLLITILKRNTQQGFADWEKKNRLIFFFTQKEKPYIVL